jgi:DUF438 domain-containing protein
LKAGLDFFRIFVNLFNYSSTLLALLNLKDWSENGIMEEKIMFCFVHHFKAMAASEKLTNRLPPLSPTTQLHKKFEI